MKRLVSLPFLAAFLMPAPALAAAIFGGGKPVRIHEDYVFLHHDDAAKRVHLLFTARVAPAFRRIALGLPTPARPTIETLDLDLPATLHQLMTPHELRTKNRPPVPPAPWATHGAKLADSWIISKGFADSVFDLTWTQRHTDNGHHIALMSITTPDDDRVEVISPTLHLVYEADELTWVRQEPSLPIAGADPADADPLLKNRSPVTIEVDHIEPRNVGVTGEKIEAILRNKSDSLLECQAQFLEAQGNESVELAMEMTTRPLGSLASVKPIGANEGAKEKLFDCVFEAIRTTKWPTASDGYRYSLTLVFTPPRIASRRTHVLVLGSSMTEWKDLPSSVRLQTSHEVLADDVKNAFSAGILQKLGLRTGQRLWLSYWLDREPRRTMAEDVVFARQALPAVEVPVIEPSRPEAAKPKPQLFEVAGMSRKKTRMGMLLGFLALSFLGTLWMTRDELRFTP